MAQAQKIHVLVVDDSEVTLMFLVHVLSADPDIEVMGTARNGQEALDFLQHATPDVILMDIDMPKMDGYEATRRIMETQPVPIVICSGSTNLNESVTSFRVLEAGAVACVEKPFGREHQQFEGMIANLLQTVKLMAEVKVVRRWPRLRQQEGAGTAAGTLTKTPRPSAAAKIIGIGASTGGPPVIQTILSSLPKDFASPILIVQHIASGFLPGLAEWLNQTTGAKIQIAGHGMIPMPGHVYLAPDDYHLTLRATGQLALSKEPPDNGLRPSIDRLFRSLAEHRGPSAVGVILTGMGRDGADALKLMKDRGALTIAQDQETSIIFGMPGEAIALGAAAYILPADRIAAMLISSQNYHAPAERGTL